MVNSKADQEKAAGTTLSTAKVAELYSGRCKVAPDTEPLSKDCMDRALAVYKSLLAVPEVRKCIEWCEENYGVEKRDCPFQPIQRTSLESTVSG